MHLPGLVGFNKFRFPEIKKDDGFLYIDDAHRLIVLIEYQNFGIQLPVSIVIDSNLTAEVVFTSSLSAWSMNRR